MRTSLVNRATVVLLLLSVAGCSTTQPFWNKLSWHKPSAAASSSTLGSPASASFAPPATSAQPVAMPSGAQQASAAMPVYPGTPYPVTPYSSAASATFVPANNSAYSATASAAPSSSVPVGGYMPQNVAGAASAQPANVYTTGQQGQAYGATQGQPYYAPQQSDSYNAAAAQPGAYTR